MLATLAFSLVDGSGSMLVSLVTLYTLSMLILLNKASVTAQLMTLACTNKLSQFGASNRICVLVKDVTHVIFAGKIQYVTHLQDLLLVAAGEISESIKGWMGEKRIQKQFKD